MNTVTRCLLIYTLELLQNLDTQSKGGKLQIWRNWGVKKQIAGMVKAAVGDFKPCSSAFQNHAIRPLWETGEMNLWSDPARLSCVVLDLSSRS